MTDIVEAKKVIRDLKSDKPAVAVKAAEKILTEVDTKHFEKGLNIKKTVFVDMSPTTPKVTFTGGLWSAMDIKLANKAVIHAFRKMLRELYRKEYKKQ